MPHVPCRPIELPEAVAVARDGTRMCACMHAACTQCGWRGQPCTQTRLGRLTASSQGSKRWLPRPSKLVGLTVRAHVATAVTPPARPPRVREGRGGGGRSAVRLLGAHVDARAHDLIHQQQLARQHRRALQHLQRHATKARRGQGELFA